MQIFSFLNSRNIGNTSYINSQALSPVLDSVIPRLACQEKDVYASFGETGAVPPFASKFRKDKCLDILAVANEDGDVMLIDTSKEDDNLLSFTAHHNAIYDICWFSDKYRLITVSGDHTACVWDMNTLKNIGCFKKHSESIKSVDVCREDNAVFATGSRDGTICVWDVRCENAQCKPSSHIKFAHCKKVANKSKFSDSRLSNSVSAVAFQDSSKLASTGASDSVVKVWDLKKTNSSQLFFTPAPCYQMKYKDDKKQGYGYTSLVFDSDFKRLYASCTANKILMFNCHTYADAETVYDGLQCNTYFIKLALSNDDRYLACGSSSNKAYVWKVNQAGHPKWEFPGHTSEVTTVAWGYDAYNVPKLVTCGDDNRILIWKAINREIVEQLEKYPLTASKYEFCTSTTTNSGFSDCNSPPKTIPSPNSTKTPVTIKNFFQSLLSPQDMSKSHQNNDVQSAPINGNVHPISPNTLSTVCSDSSSPPKTILSYSPNQTKIPVIKSIKNFYQPLSSPPDMSRENKDVLSPSKKVNPNTPPHSNILSSNSQGKENQLDSCSSDTVIRQIKRKSFTESNPEIQRKFKKGRRNNLSVKKQNSEGNIKNYFTSSLSPKE